MKTLRELSGEFDISTLSLARAARKGYLEAVKPGRDWLTTRKAVIDAIRAGRLQPRLPLAERFWLYVDVGGPDECWLWRGKVGLAGYDCFSVKGAWQMARIVAWKITNGEIPYRMFVSYRCNPHCVNPAHLFLSGHQNAGRIGSNSKLNWHKVKEIRRRAANGEVQRKLAREYGVDESTVSHILAKRRWWPEYD